MAHVNVALPSAPPDATSAEPSPGVADVMAEVALIALVNMLRRRPDLVGALKELLVPNEAARATSTQAFATVAQYAASRSVSERTIRYDIKAMKEGTHFHKVGRKRRRVVIHVQEADAWYAQRAVSRDTASVEQLAVDEVTRRRARVALKKREEQG